MFDLNTDSENKKIYSDTNLLKLENCFIYSQINWFYKMLVLK